jgi:phosphoribosylamine--glycine ligase
VIAAPGYPDAPEAGGVIEGLDRAEHLEGVTVFHAGTAERDGRVVAAGGRVLNVTALGADLASARSRAYEAVELIDLPGGQVRTDIGAAAAVGRGV